MQPRQSAWKSRGAANSSRGAANSSRGAANSSRGAANSSRGAANSARPSTSSSRGAENSARPSTSSSRGATNFARPSTSFARPSTSFVRPPTIEYPDLPPFNFAEKKHGTPGNCAIKANFASLKITNKIIYHYTIEIKGRDRINNIDDSKSKNKTNLKQQKRNERIVRGSNFSIFRRLIEENPTVFTSEPAFDCRQNVYSRTEIIFNDDENNKKKFEVRIRVPEKKFPQTFDIVLNKPNPNIIDFGRLYEENIRSAEKELQALDIIINYGVKRFNLVLNSNSFLKFSDLLNMNQQDRERINFELDSLKEGRFGHYSAVKLSEKGPQLCVDRVASVFNKGGNMLNIIRDFCFQSRNRFRNRNNPPIPVQINRNFRLERDELAELNRELKGLDFEANHLRNRPKSTIYEITQRPVQEITFPLKNRETNEEKITSVKAYFEGLYTDYCRERLAENQHELYGNLPCIQVDKFNPKYFPMEVVDICYDQYYRKKLNSDQQKGMTQTCGRQNPMDRFAENESQIQNIIRCSSRCENDYLRQFGIEIAQTFNIVKGRILADPYLLGGSQFKPFNAQWKPDQTSGFEVKFDTTDFNWVVVNITRVDGRDYRRAPQNGEVDTLIKTLINAARFNGITLPPPSYIDYNEAVDVVNADIEDLILKAKTDAKAKLMVILLPTGTEDLYHKIKFISECQQDIVTQCISHSKSRSFREMSYCGNIILKINAKLGGVNAILDRNCKVGFLKGKNMIMGLDVTHPSRADRSQNSIASAVASYDSKMVNYHSTSVVQSSGYKEIVNLETMVTELFEKFHNRNQFYPEKLIVYRDGVSEGQFNQVVTLEIRSMQNAFNKLHNAKKSEGEVSYICNPKVTYIICQKRHNTRFLAVNPKDRLKSGNVRPGLVVDNGIVTNYNEFYLCAHFGALGTSRPTRYIVLLDESNFTGDELHQATYNLSYLFPRCLKAVSIVPPVLYAHLAAKRARSYVANLNPADRENYGDEALERERIERINRQIQVRGQLENRLYFL